MKEDKKESILKTARQMFIRYGLQKTSLEEIARLSRVAKATIYNYFGGKEQVFIEVINREIMSVSVRIDDAVAQMKTPVEKLRAFMFTAFGVLKDNGEILNLQNNLFDRLIHKSVNIHKMLFNSQAATLQNILKDGVRLGLFKTDDLPTVRSILYALRGIQVTWLLNRDDAEVERDLEGLFKLLCAGIMVNGKASRA